MMSLHSSLTSMAMIRRMALTVLGLLTLGVAFVLPHVSVAEHVQACTMEYAPVCGERDVVCVRAPCPPVQETFGNRCSLEAAHARFLYTGECRGGSVGSPPSYPTPDPIPVPNPDEPVSDYPTYEPPKNCTAWFDGCNSCSRGPNGLAMCTLRACMGPPQAGYCTAYAVSGGNTTTGSSVDEGYTPESSCRAWFDGCNTCQRMEDGGAACTKKFCAEPEIGYCTEYDEAATSSEEVSTGAIPAVFKETGKSFVEFFHTLLSRLFGWAIL